MLENIDKIIEFVTMLTTVLFVICRSNANVKKKIDEHLKPNGGSSIKDALDRIEAKLEHVEATQRALLDLQEESAGHFLCDRRGEVFWVSDIFCEIMDLGRDECFGAKWLTAIEDQQQAAIHNYWRVKVHTGSVANIDFATSKNKQVRLRSVPIIDSSETLIGFVGSLKNLDTSGL